MRHGQCLLPLEKPWRVAKYTKTRNYKLVRDTLRIWSTYSHFSPSLLGLKVNNSDGTNTQRVVQSHKSLRDFVVVLAWKQRTRDVFLFVAHLSLGSLAYLYPILIFWFPWCFLAFTLAPLTRRVKHDSPTKFSKNGATNIVRAIILFPIPCT